MMAIDFKKFHTQHERTKTRAREFIELYKKQIRPGDIVPAQISPESMEKHVARIFYETEKLVMKESKNGTKN
jgi:hypothetical protein